METAKLANVHRRAPLIVTKRTRSRRQSMLNHRNDPIRQNSLQLLRAPPLRRQPGFHMFGLYIDDAPVMPRRRDVRRRHILRWPGCSSASLRIPASLAVRPLHPCSGVRRHAAHPALARHGESEARLRLAFRDLGPRRPRLRSHILWQVPEARGETDNLHASGVIYGRNAWNR
jgi:hypothetical protein